MATLEKAVEQYAAALRGELEVHIWRGKPSPWMKDLVVEPGTVVDPIPADCSPEFQKDTGMYYDGIMPQEEVRSRLEELQGYSSIA